MLYRYYDIIQPIHSSYDVLQKLLVKILDEEIERSLSTKPTRWCKETLVLPYSASLKDVDFDPILSTAQAAIPPGIRNRLTINISLNYPIPVGFLFENNAFGKMELAQKLAEESICHCAGRAKF